MPIANQNHHENQEGNKEQAEGFGGVRRVPAVLIGGIVLVTGWHKNIVRPPGHGFDFARFGRRAT